MAIAKHEQLMYERAKKRILADMKSGRIPKNVRRFSTLHNYVDANMYLVGWTKAAERRDKFTTLEKDMPRLTRVLNRLNNWLKNR